MRLTVEIKDKKFIYSYEVGESSHNSSSHLTADNLVAFVQLLQVCSSSHKWSNEQFMNKLHGKAWVEQNPAEALDLAKKHIAGSSATAEKDPK